MTKFISTLFFIFYSFYSFSATQSNSIPQGLPVLPPPVSIPVISNESILKLNSPVSNLDLYESISISDFVRINSFLFDKPYVLKDFDFKIRYASNSGKLTFSMLKSILAQNSISIVDHKTYYSLDLDSSYFYYKPKHKPISYFIPYFSLLKGVTFSTSTGLSASKQEGSKTTAFNQLEGNPDFLIAFGSSSDLDTLKKFITFLDVPSPVVSIRAYILEVKRTSSNSTGVSLVASFFKDKLKLKLGSSLSDGFVFSLGDSKLSISDLLDNSAISLISSPTLTVSSGSQASSTVGSDVPVVSSVVSNGSSVSNAITYQTSGVLLSVTPTLFQDSISLDISSELSSFVKTSVTSLDAPTKLKRSFSSKVSINSGDLVVLGGLSEYQSVDSSSIPFFSWFSSTYTSHSDTELVLVISASKL